MSEKDNNERKKAHHIEAPDIELSVRETFGICLLYTSDAADE